MIKTIIVDDELDGSDVLNILIKDYCTDLSVVEICNSGQSAVKAIIKHQPELLFLDINMPGMSGFDVLDCIKNMNVKVIFVTAHNQHAIRAFKYSTVDYILKPASAQQLIEAVEKAKKIEFSDNKISYSLLLNSFKNEVISPQIIALPMADGLQVISIEDIMYCKAEGNYTFVYLYKQKAVLVSKQLKEFEKLLTQYSFFRVHHSAIINLKYVTKYVRGEGGYVIMKDECSIEVSRQKKDQLLRLINKV